MPVVAAGADAAVSLRAGSARMSRVGIVRMSEAGSVRMSKVIRARKIVRGFEYPSLLLVLVLLRRCWHGAWAYPKYGLSACPRQGMSVVAAGVVAAASLLAV